MRFGVLDNAYNASQQPITGFNRHKLNGVEKFKRDEHFLYLRQYEDVREAPFSRSQAGLPGWQGRIDPAHIEAIAKLRKNCSFIPPANNDHIKRRIRRVSLAVAAGVTVVFSIATSIGVYW
ncbi:hypothetical protein X943_004086 [Babesia divergens]|uniref:Uncharacterized protein n=1 Tax=Babesia divergens TaxID=32595 RepID=A0AAD9G9T2_BABDI|nr:hypothetical protein X943_004086 [Babesia divergens]